MSYDDEDVLMGAYFDDEASAMMGAPMFARWLRHAGRRPSKSAMRTYKTKRQAARKVLTSALPGAPESSGKVWPLGFPIATFTNTSGTALTVSQSVSKPFEGQRVIIATARTGPTATGLITFQALNMGTDLQSPATGPIAADAFAPDAVDAALKLTRIQPGVDASVQFNTSVAPGAGDQIDVQMTVIGLSYG